MSLRGLAGQVSFFLAAAGCATLVLADSQTSVGVGLDYTEGKYGESTKSTTWSMPVMIKHETGPLTLKLNIPYVRSSGVAAAGGDRFVSTKQTQSGLGDVTATALYTVYSNVEAQAGIDLGVKAKFATADKSKELLTTGKNDYSLLVDAYKGFGDTTVFGTLGKTKKGDPDGTDFRDPWFASVGFSNKLSTANSWGASYDYRQKVTASGDPISEVTLFAIHKYSKQVKVQAYAVTGFSDASPDFGLGATVTYTY